MSLYGDLNLFYLSPKLPFLNNHLSQLLTVDARRSGVPLDKTVFLSIAAEISSFDIASKLKSVLISF